MYGGGLRDPRTSSVQWSEARTSLKTAGIHDYTDLGFNEIHHYQIAAQSKVIWISPSSEVSVSLLRNVTRWHCQHVQLSGSQDRPVHVSHSLGRGVQYLEQKRRTYAAAKTSQKYEFTDTVMIQLNPQQVNLEASDN